MSIILQSTVALTHELDNIALAASELVHHTLGNIERKDNRFGILLCDSDTDHEALYEELKKQLDMPIIGCSTISVITDHNGLTDMSASLMTIASDDAFFSLAKSDPLTPENVAEQIEKTYEKARASLTGDPVLAIAFPPYILGIMLDIYPRVLDHITGGLPVFGGIPAHDELNGKNVVFTGDAVSSDRLTVLLLSNVVKPVFSVKNNLSTLAEIKRTVTHAEDNVIYRVGDQTFVDFLIQFGLDVHKIADMEDKTTSFTAYPLMIELDHNAQYDGVPIVRTIHCLDVKTGSGTAIGEVPQGCTISLGALKTQDIEASAKNSIKDIIEKMKKFEDQGYRYSTLFAVSCMGRYFVMADKNTLEADILMGNLPQGLSMCGFYSFGEICPTSIKDHKAMNAAHNESLVILAI